MTRARAAAKAMEGSEKPTSLSAAAARLRPTKTEVGKEGAGPGRKPTIASKRKMRPEEADNDADLRGTATRRATRGRARADTAADPKPVEATTTVRSKANSRTVTATKLSTAEAAPAMTRPRGRPKKTPSSQTGEEPVPRVTRPRVASTMRSISSTATPATKSKGSVTKKTVKFQEPDKENAEPAAKTKEIGRGLRARPTRRGVAAAVRPSGQAVAHTKPVVEPKKPLSPKKVTQMPLSRLQDESEDELAGEPAMTPVRAAMQSPIRPPASILMSARKLGGWKTAPGGSTSDSIDAADPILEPGLSQALASPARRLPASPARDAMKSPAKRMMASATLPVMSAGESSDQSPILKKSLLQSAAKRPQSPCKSIQLPSPGKTQEQRERATGISMFQSPAKRSMPGFKAETEARRENYGNTPEDSPIMWPVDGSAPLGTDITLALPQPSASRISPPHHRHEGPAQASELIPPGTANFPGRLSAVLPRHADPVLSKERVSADELGDGAPLLGAEGEAAMDELSKTVQEAANEMPAPLEQPVLKPICQRPDEVDDDPMMLDDATSSLAAAVPMPLQLPPAPIFPLSVSGLARPADKTCEAEATLWREAEVEMDSDSDMDSGSSDDMPLPIKNIPTTPSRLALTTPQGDGADQGGADTASRSVVGVGRLADRFASWMTASPAPAMMGLGDENEWPLRNSYLDEEMTIHMEHPPSLPEAEAKLATGEEGQGRIPEALLSDFVMTTEEDDALAREADEMSFMDPSQLDDILFDEPLDDDLSEASQDYSDENKAGTDSAPGPAPATSGIPVLGPRTPLRPARQGPFYTTTKVPLKPADDSTPTSARKGSHSAPRVRAGRRASLSSSSAALAGAASPGRTKATAEPRAERRVDPLLLRGAVVLVDVYTKDGADASCLFVELLGQMGARCVDSWPWEPASSRAGESGKIGITHVVFKDGGQETMDKVRAAGDAVYCVGVNWVLE